ncbi:hypothetical protein HYQ46_003259 [Verticillium longisporum]|nr:hypothetical protein HYQ46_003259 [Verticillium longisporum]
MSVTERAPASWLLHVSWARRGVTAIAEVRSHGLTETTGFMFDGPGVRQQAHGAPVKFRQVVHNDSTQTLTQRIRLFRRCHVA